MKTQFAHDLRMARKKAGYRQCDLAHLLACHQSILSTLETGKQRPSLEQIIELSLIYGRSFESLFAEVMAERKKHLRRRLKTLRDPRKRKAQTFNRQRSLQRLRERLEQPDEYGGA